jgi:hypothetical protein
MLLKGRKAVGTIAMAVIIISVVALALGGWVAISENFGNMRGNGSGSITASNSGSDYSVTSAISGAEATTTATLLVYSTETETVTGAAAIATETSYSTTTLTVTSTLASTQTATASASAGNLVNFSIDSLILNATTNSWTLVMTNYNNGDWTVDATLTATSGSGGSSTVNSDISLYPFRPGVDSQTVSGIGPNPIQAGNYYCVAITGSPTGTTVPIGDWNWSNCFVLAVK